jgi:hypothetical protein
MATDPRARAAAALSRAAAATPGPWEWRGKGYTNADREDCPLYESLDSPATWVIDCGIMAEDNLHYGIADVRTADAVFIAAAREDVPALVADVTAAADLLAALSTDPYAGLDRVGGRYEWECRFCCWHWHYTRRDEPLPMPIPHDADCLITRARAWLAGTVDGSH